ncbi:MAG: DUF1573 domain-containing protein [Muribaculaceae bacterium]|nr:DUF1573 domain-containing protein [Muribaculaceae bacterium]
MKRFSLFGRKLRLLQASGSLFLFALAFSAYPQIEKTLEFIPDHVDFGKIREEDGRVSQKVKAVNISSDTTFIISARTSCGCSAAEYPEHSFAPGDTVEVTLSYDPQNRPGKFLKTARFFTGEERIANSIKLSGTVIPSRKNLDKAYPDSVGCLRLSTRFVDAGEISRTEARPLFVGIYNDSDKELPLAVSTDAAALEAGLVPDTIEPFGIGTITLMLKGRLIPSSLQDVNYNAYMMSDTDTLLTIPVFCRVRK